MFAFSRSRFLLLTSSVSQIKGVLKLSLGIMIKKSDEKKDRILLFIMFCFLAILGVAIFFFAIIKIIRNIRTPRRNTTSRADAAYSEPEAEKKVEDLLALFPEQ